MVAITMEEGIAHIFLISKHKTQLKAKVEKSVAKAKSGFTSKHNATKNKFFDNVIATLEKLFTGENVGVFEKVNVVVIGSPGFVRENFYNHVKEVSEKRNSIFLKDVLSKTILSHCSSGFKHSLNELMSN